MKVEQIIDEMQASLTKLRGHFRKTKSAGECTCPPRYTKLHPYPAPDELINIDVDCPIHGSLKKATKCGQCGRFLIQAYTSGRIHCPYCLQKEMSGIPDILHGTPDLPLHVRVAKALGYKVIRRQTGKWSMPRTSMEQEYIEYVPDYPNDLVAAMGALEEYCQKNGLIWGLRPPAGDAQYWDIIDTRKDGTYTHIGSDVQTAPQAISEAIVAHAEQQ